MSDSNAMNAGDEKLLERYLDGRLTDAEAVQLRELLRSSAQARRRLRDLATIDAKLTELAAGCPAATDLLCSDSRAKAAPVFNAPADSLATARVALRPLSGVILGLVVGIVCSSMAWAYSVPRWKPRSDKLIGLIEETFELNSQIQPKGVPARPDVWSGDYAELTGPVADVQPASGNRMVRLLRADYEGKPVRGGYIAEIYRLVDVRSFDSAIEAGESVIQVAARFNSIVAPMTEEYHGSLSIYALDRETATSGATQDGAANLASLALATSHRNCEILDRDPSTWQDSFTELRLPAGTEYLLLRFAIAHGRREHLSSTDVFGGHFIDDVRVAFFPSSATSQQ